MKKKGRSLAVATITLFAAVLLFPKLSHSVHKVDAGGSFICSGCHTIHDSENGADVGDTNAQRKLLRMNGDDLCLACHTAGTTLNGEHEETPVVKNTSAVSFDQKDPNSIGAGGNFAYLTGNDNGTTDNQGYGHNLADGVNPAGNTGATYNMHCCTCHDPHGAETDDETAAGVDKYRNLKKVVLDSSGTASSGVNITNNAEGTTQNSSGFYKMSGNKYGIEGTGSVGSGFSLWCEQCHGSDFHGDDRSGSPARYTRHPMNVQMKDLEEPDDYLDLDPNAYGLGGALVNSATYIKLPLEDGPESSSENPGPHGNEKGDRVFCLSCHFPHAGPYADALRWNNTAALADGQGCQQCHNK